MAINFESVQHALKTHYGPATANQVNTECSPIIPAVKKVLAGGYEFRFGSPFGVNGGAAFLPDDETLPAIGGQKYAQFSGKLANLYGVVQFSDKAWKASRNSADSFFNVAKQEFESLTADLKMQLGRAIYGDKSGKLCAVSEASSTASATLSVDDTSKLVEGMMIDMVNTSAGLAVNTDILRITSVDHTQKKVTFDKSVSGATEGYILTIHGSYNAELTGLNSLFDAEDIYGIKTADNKFLLPTSVACDSEGISDDAIFDLLADLSQRTGAETDMLVCGSDAFRSYAKYLRSINHRIEADMELKGGWKGMAFNFNGRLIPIVMDRFCDKDSMLALETKKMALYQLGDFEWMTYAGGNVIERVSGKPVYQGAMSRYCQLVCEHPGGLGRLTNCTGSAA